MTLDGVYYRMDDGDATVYFKNQMQISIAGSTITFRRKQHRNVSPAVAAANNSATATAARQHDNQRALDERRKERSRKRKGGGSITQASIARFVSPRAVLTRCISAGWEAPRPQAVAIWYKRRNGQ